MKYKLPESITASFFDLPSTGDKDYGVNYVASLDAADPDSIIFYSRDDISFLKNLEAGIIIADIKLKNEVLDHKSKAIVYSEKPKYIFLSLLEKFFNNSFEDGPESFKNLASVIISETSYIESKVLIGEGSEIYPLVAIYNPTVIGKNCRVQSGSVIGGMGLGDLWYNGRYNNFVHLGSVVIEDDVTIGTNVNISRGMLEDTIIGAGTRIANNVSVGHSVVIGKNCYISSGVTIGGACVIEDNSWIAIGATLIDHVKVGKNTMIGTGAVLIKDALEDSVYLGNPARRISERNKE
jgi:UDP-3-O-[3-hydroxymyristoyl] glucosamine N-acyltransferase